jgi:nucleolar protein 9
MPKELKKRQRGGRSKKKNDSEQQGQADVETGTQQNDTEFHEQDFVPLGDAPAPSAGPSQPRSAAAPPAFGNNEIDPAAPFGFVDPDIKAYFRSVDERLREWEGLGLALGEDAESELEGVYRNLSVDKF